MSFNNPPQEENKITLLEGDTSLGHHGRPSKPVPSGLTLPEHLLPTPNLLAVPISLLVQAN
jgi:hypothetical protein